MARHSRPALSKTAKHSHLNPSLRSRLAKKWRTVGDPPDSPPPSEGLRPFRGYDRERAAYARHKADLLARFEGEFVVAVGDELIGPYETFEAALRAGWRRFGPGPLYVQQVLEEEPIAEVGHDIEPCRSERTTSRWPALKRSVFWSIRGPVRPSSRSRSSTSSASRK